MQVSHTITPRAVEVARYMRDHERRHRVAPTLVEVGAALGVSKTTVWGHAQALVAHGVVEARGRAFTRRYRYNPASKLLDDPERRLEVARLIIRDLIVEGHIGQAPKNGADPAVAVVASRLEQEGLP